MSPDGDAAEGEPCIHTRRNIWCRSVEFSPTCRQEDKPCFGRVDGNSEATEGGNEVTIPKKRREARENTASTARTATKTRREARKDTEGISRTV